MMSLEVRWKQSGIIFTPCEDMKGVERDSLIHQITVPKNLIALV